MARRFGLGSTYEIGLKQRAGSGAGHCLQAAKLSKDPVWHGGETPNMGIGQGYLNLNPLQLCVQAARLAGSGVALKPRLIHSIGGIVQPSGGEGASSMGVDPEHLAFIRAAMTSVANDVGGTAAAKGAAKLGLGT